MQATGETIRQTGEYAQNILIYALADLNMVSIGLKERFRLPSNPKLKCLQIFTEINKVRVLDSGSASDSPWNLNVCVCVCTHVHTHPPHTLGSPPGSSTVQNAA